MWGMFPPVPGCQYQAASTRSSVAITVVDLYHVVPIYRSPTSSPGSNVTMATTNDVWWCCTPSCHASTSSPSPRGTKRTSSPSSWPLLGKPCGYTCTIQWETWGRKHSQILRFCHCSWKFSLQIWGHVSFGGTIGSTASKFYFPPMVYWTIILMSGWVLVQGSFISSPYHRPVFDWL